MKNGKRIASVVEIMEKGQSQDLRAWRKETSIRLLPLLALVGLARSNILLVALVGW